MTVVQGFLVVFLSSVFHRWYHLVFCHLASNADVWRWVSWFSRVFARLIYTVEWFAHLGTWSSCIKKSIRYLMLWKYILQRHISITLFLKLFCFIFLSIVCDSGFSSFSTSSVRFNLWWTVCFLILSMRLII